MPAGQGRNDGHGWLECTCGARHWGPHGAAGLLLTTDSPEGEQILLQHRVAWSHHGGTWGLPGGARHSDETPVEAALRETWEETGVEASDVVVDGVHRLEHGAWRYDTVFGRTDRLLPLTPCEESQELSWVPALAVPHLPLHPSLSAAWPILRGPRMRLVVDVANLVGSTPDGWWRDRAAGSRRTLDQLDGLVGTLALRDDPRLAVRIVAVVEGAAVPGAQEWNAERQTRSLLEIVTAAGSGDDSIVDTVTAMTDDAGPPVVVVTSDAGLRRRVASAGATCVGVKTLREAQTSPD